MLSLALYCTIPQSIAYRIAISQTISTVCHVKSGTVLHNTTKHHRIPYSDITDYQVKHECDFQRVFHRLRQSRKIDHTPPLLLSISHSSRWQWIAPEHSQPLTQGVSHSLTIDHFLTTGTILSRQHTLVLMGRRQQTTWRHFSTRSQYAWPNERFT